MPLSVFFQPVPMKQIAPEDGFASVQIGSVVNVYESAFPELNGDNKPDLALFGVEDDRKSLGNEGCAAAANAVRKQFYELYVGDTPLKLADLGNIAAGETVNDTYVAVQKVC